MRMWYAYARRRFQFWIKWIVERNCGKIVDKTNGWRSAAFTYIVITARSWSHGKISRDIGCWTSRASIAENSAQIFVFLFDSNFFVFVCDVIIPKSRCVANSFNTKCSKRRKNKSNRTAAKNNEKKIKKRSVFTYESTTFSVVYTAVRGHARVILCR